MKTYSSFSQGIATILVVRNSQPQNYLCFGLGFKLSDLVRFIKNQMKDLRKISEFHIYVGTQDKATLWKSLLRETSNYVRRKLLIIS